MYLITPSLLNSYLYYLDDERENAKDEFYKTLNKEFTTSEAIQKGIDFENKIFAYTNKEVQEYTEIETQIGDIVNNGLWQVVVKKDIIIDNQEFLLYGKADVIKENWIYDIKTTASYELGKYKNSMQHRLYMVCTGIKNFEYLVYDKEFYKEFYSFTEDTENELKDCISNFMYAINSNEEFKKVFQEKWTCKY